MRNSLPGFLIRILAALLVVNLGGFVIASAQHITDQDIASSIQGDDPDDDDQGESRVARLSFVSGDVSFLRDGATDWAAAVVNLPLISGDHVYCPAGARAEIQLGRGSYIRLSEKTELAIAMLSDSVAQLEIVEGTANIRVDHLAAAFDRFEVDTPTAALLLQKDGQYRIDVGSKGESEIIVRRGIADVTTTDGSFKVREGYKLEVGDAGNLEIALDNSLDDWDRWIYDRDTDIDRTMIASSPDDVSSYETDYNSFYGASDLASYGSWTNVSSYGNCWLPRVSSGWVPYRLGEWLWVSRLGWTWVSYEPWGWAPYHYGRWVYISSLGWAWVPGFNSFPHRRNYFRWRPALVSFFNCGTSSGQYVGWYPLRPGERWRRPERYGEYGSVIRGGARRPDVARDARERHGASWIPVSGFTRSGQSGDRGSGELGRSRPQAPDRNLGPLIGGNQRPGLPPGTPGRSAMAPGGRWTLVRPSADIIQRPVITRNLPTPTPGSTDSRPTNPAGVSLAIPRQRTLVEPGPVRALPAKGNNRRLDVESGPVNSGGDVRGRSDGAGVNTGRSGDGVRSRRPGDGQENGNGGSNATGVNRDLRPQDGTIIRRTPVMTDGGARSSGNDSTRSAGDSGNQSGGDNSGSTRSRERERQHGEDQSGGGNNGRQTRSTGGGGDSGRSERNNNSDDGGRWRSTPGVITRPAPDSSSPRHTEPQPEPRREPPRPEPRYEQPRPEPKHDQPRVEPRAEPRSEPSYERPRPEPRPEPRNEPRPEPRVEPKHEQPQQRSEPPRAEPKHESPPPTPPAKHDSPPPDRPRKP
ncbi:MAG TPA: DUF6600 domain-containing protein [Blastocatellia bacterium]|nr:DUF6600 domain-containing protein [Blastocatellia bacterium]